MSETNDTEAKARKESKTKSNSNLNQEKRNFVTGSSYEGVWDSALNCMSGYGIYTFVDGSTYRGHFFNGRFHGQGTLRLAEPYGMTFKGSFDNGRLIQANEITFSDDVPLEDVLYDDKIHLVNWKYCSPLDRRFAVEIREGIPPVGPESNLTPGEPNTLESGEYDLIGGVFSAETRLITRQPPPFTPERYVDCEDFEEIMNKCRRAPVDKVTISPRTCNRIMEMNLASERELEHKKQSCAFDQEKMRVQYFGEPCLELKSSDAVFKDQTVDTSDASTLDSIDKDILEVLATSRKCDKPGSLSVAERDEV